MEKSFIYAVVTSRNLGHAPEAPLWSRSLEGLWEAQAELGSAYASQKLPRCSLSRFLSQKAIFHGRKRRIFIAIKFKRHHRPEDTGRWWFSQCKFWMASVGQDTTLSPISGMRGPRSEAFAFGSNPKAPTLNKQIPSLNPRSTREIRALVSSYQRIYFGHSTLGCFLRPLIIVIHVRHYDNMRT